MILWLTAAFLILSLVASGLVGCSTVVHENNGGINANRGNDYKLPYVAEAEEGRLSSGVNVYDMESGFSGKGYVGQFKEEGDYVEVDVLVPEEGNYELIIRYLIPKGYGDKINSIYINGKYYGAITFTEEHGFAEKKVGIAQLNEGKNVIKFQKNPGDWGWMFVDNFTVNKITTKSAWKFDVSAQLINPNADEKTKKLFEYLCSIYGKKILTGQQLYFSNEEEINKIFSITGKLPAIKGYDMINQTPGGHIDDQVERAIDWHIKHKGIVTMCWHWWAPKDGRAFYTKDTKFDITKAVTPGTEEYELIIRDMDIVAGKLKEMQEAGVPVLWRPLHEASGGWFWWGAKGPEAYKKLWRLMYDRFTNYHKLNNLIWVWNGQHPEWYVGDEYCDIVGEDIYPGKRVYSSHPGKFGENYDIVRASKPIALTETGCLPDPEHIKTTGAWWLWFMIWWGDFITTDEYNDYEMLKKVYNHEDVITLDELPTGLFK